MNCPYCNSEMKNGVIQSQHEIKWQKSRRIFMYKSENDITLSALNIWKGSAVRAFLCEECRKVIIDYADATCDMNEKSADIKADE